MSRFVVITRKETPRGLIYSLCLVLRRKVSLENYINYMIICLAFYCAYHNLSLHSMHLTQFTAKQVFSFFIVTKDRLSYCFLINLFQPSQTEPNQPIFFHPCQQFPNNTSIRHTQNCWSQLDYGFCYRTLLFLEWKRIAWAQFIHNRSEVKREPVKSVQVGFHHSKNPQSKNIPDIRSEVFILMWRRKKKS